MSFLRKGLLYASISLLLVSCSVSSAKKIDNFFKSAPFSQAKSTQISKPLIDTPEATTIDSSHETPTATLVPTKTIRPTRTPIPATKTPANFPTPTQVITLPDTDHLIKFVLLGSDQRPDDFGFRTDTIILVLVNPKTKTTSMVSIPRDLYVHMPGRDESRINAAMVFGGFPLLQETFRHNFGIIPDHYVLINFTGFIYLIDTLGGINVYVNRTIIDQREGIGEFELPKGWNLMDGETALWYVRAREKSSDLDRNRRQQEVMHAIIARMLNLNMLANAPKFFEAYKKSIVTDLTLSEFGKLLPTASKLTDLSSINHYSFGAEHITDWRTPAGAQVLLQNESAVKSLLLEAINP